MKKVISILSVASLLVTATSCNSNKKAFEASKAAYENIDLAYKITEQYASDLYEAWRLGIYESDEIINNGVEFLADELSLNEEEIKNGVAYAIADITDKDWETLSENEKENLKSDADIVFTIMEDDLFSFCVIVVNSAYTTNGKVDEASNSLNEAKTQMKELSEKYSDYEHYPNLKEYYTTTSAFFNFCQEPSGSFEQVKDTINNYKNDARNYINDLDYIFEE